MLYINKEWMLGDANGAVA